jgi:hypothetical protein
MFDIRKIQEETIANVVAECSDRETAEQIVYGKDECAKEESNGVWVNATMKRLEEKFTPAQTKQIRMHCQCGYGMDEKVALLQELKATNPDIETWANSEKAKAAGLFYENGFLYLQFDFCPCPMLAEVDHLESKTWCECTTGYSKVLFEKAFHCKVDVELLESIKAGDKRCLMKMIFS